MFCSGICRYGRWNVWVILVPEGYKEYCQCCKMAIRKDIKDSISADGALSQRIPCNFFSSISWSQHKTGMKRHHAMFCWIWIISFVSLHVFLATPTNVCECFLRCQGLWVGQDWNIFPSWLRRTIDWCWQLWEWKVLTTAHWIAAKLDADILRKISTCKQANLLNVTVLTLLLQAC